MVLKQVGTSTWSVGQSFLARRFQLALCERLSDVWLQGVLPTDVMSHCCDWGEKVILGLEQWRADVSVIMALCPSSESSLKKVEVCMPSLVPAGWATLWVKVQVRHYLGVSKIEQSNDLISHGTLVACSATWETYCITSGVMYIELYNTQSLCLRLS